MIQTIYCFDFVYFFTFYLMNNLLNINDLSVSIGDLQITKEVSFDIQKGETLALVGESGCGKSITAHSILRLLPKSANVTGEINIDGKSVLDLNNKDLRSLRGNDVGMIFQEPMTSLNPVFTIGNQMSESLRIHLNMSKREALERSIELLNAVGIPQPEMRVKDYPHQLSGGMRQRVMIAIAISCNPKLIIADEPTTALDVTIQAQILDLIIDLKRDHNTAMLLISHNLGVVYETSQKVCVMYLGRIVEVCETKTLFTRPHHPYTKGLLNSTPMIGKDLKKQRLHTIPGDVPSFTEVPRGCRFNTRCEFAFDRCFQEEPDLSEVEPGHKSRCFLDKDIKKTL